MSANEFVFYTLLLLVICNLIGLFISLLLVYGKGLKKYRIQDRNIKREVYFKRFPLIGKNILMLAILSGVGVYILFPLFDDTLEFKAWTIIWQVLFVLFIDDFFFYFFHKWLHDNKYMLRKVHGIHHRASAPFALDYMYVHPLEWLIGYIGPIVGLLLIGSFTLVNIWAFWLYQLIRNLHELDVHSGFKSSISKYIPLWGINEHHDKHHETLNGNYASTFTLWDKILKTEIK